MSANEILKSRGVGVGVGAMEFIPATWLKQSCQILPGKKTF